MPGRDSTRDRPLQDRCPDAVSLAGAWQIRMDPESSGARRDWYRERFDGDPATLPGTVDTNPRQQAATSGDLHGFAAVYPYRGAVWYQREVEVPGAWRGRRIVLFLERCQWETWVWVDDAFQGTRNSLAAPHVYDLGSAPAPGRRRLTIMVDNSNRRTGMEVGPDNLIRHHDLTTDVQAGSKLNCGGHHIWSHNWNGILGRIELQPAGDVAIASVDVYPDLAAGSVRVRVKLANTAGTRETVRVVATCDRAGASGASGGARTETPWTVALSGQREEVVERTLALTGSVATWDEFEPNLYEIVVRLESPHAHDARRVVFGMRELATQGTRLTLNGKTVFLRGTLEDFVFPLTGHPPMDVASWRKVIATAKSYGLNLLRFHTCCPPGAAFEAADELGFHIHVELAGTSCPHADESPEVEAFLSAELERILASYGNHPSFLSLSMGNEQLIARGEREFMARHAAVLARKVRRARELDPRHLYTSTSHPWDAARADDFFVSAWPVVGSEPLCGIEWGGGRVVDCSRFNTRPPETVFDYGPAIAGLDRPLVTHEVGQWAVFPDLREISRYHGAERALNFEIIRERLREKGLVEFAGDFTRASGMLALLLYKEEIESALRTRDLSGFMLLDMHDYPGQGTSTVGILNALWESKGLTTPEAFRAFCAPTVALARIPRMVWTSRETFEASIDLANYGPAEVHARVSWSLAGEDGRTYAHGRLPERAAAQGQVTSLGEVGVPLASVPAPARLVLRAGIEGERPNAWNVWVYPDAAPAEPCGGVVLADRWDAAAKDVLSDGGRLLLAPGASRATEAVPGTFTPVFWNPQMKHLQVSKTMGILCDPASPALARFPTDFHSDWQWWDVVMRSYSICLDGLPPALRPIVQVVDSFVGSRRLAMVFEARVGEGRLLVCTADIASDLATRPVARQLRESLLAYAAGPLFRPDVPLTEAGIGGLFAAT